MEINEGKGEFILKVTLLENPYTESGNTIEHILYNRGMTPEQTIKYLKPSFDDINSPLAFGEDMLKRGAEMLIKHIQANDTVMVIVDADADGFTSSALLLNWLYDVFPSFVQNNIKFFLHSGKQHGLSDCIDLALKYNLVICPDSSSNDFSYHEQLASAGIDVLVLDHHEADVNPIEYTNACIINNQLCDYPNKELSGVGVTWQFCRYLDSLLNVNYAEEYLDLVATGCMGDMMSLLSLETKQLMFKGFREENIKNPFIYSMTQKNSFALSKADYKPSEYNQLMVSPMGVAFFVVPLINAIVRSGTLEEKQLVFKSMLKYEAFQMIPSTKRGHKLGEKERLVDQAIRTCTNVKNRQTRAQDAGVEHLENLIEENNMLEHKVLLFLLEPGEVDKGILGLCANKFMSKYQRPCLMLTKTVDEETGEVLYQGSGRGYGKEMDFRQICEDAGARFAQGHAGAFGACVEASGISELVAATDEILKDLSSEPSYFVDYIWDVSEIDGDKILNIADMNDYWGKDLDRSLVCIKNIKVTKDNFKVMKSNTLKYELPVADIIQFAGTDEQIEKFTSGDIITINAVCKCCKNEWNWTINPQLQMIDYEIVNEETPGVVEGWGF